MAASITGSALSALPSAMARNLGRRHLDEQAVGLGGQRVSVVDAGPREDLPSLAALASRLESEIGPERCRLPVAHGQGAGHPGVPGRQVGSSQQLVERLGDDDPARKGKGCEQRLAQGIELSDVTKGEGPQEGAQRQGCHHAMSEDSTGRTRAQHVTVVDTVRSGHHGVDQGQHLAPGCRVTGHATKVDQLIGQLEGTCFARPPGAELGRIADRARR